MRDSPKAAPEPASTRGSEDQQSHRTAILIDARAASRLLAISERKLGQLVARNAIPSHKIGALRRYSPADLAAWIDAGCPTEPDAAVRVRAATNKGVQR